MWEFSQSKRQFDKNINVICNADSSRQLINSIIDYRIISELEEENFQKQGMHDRLIAPQKLRTENEIIPSNYDNNNIWEEIVESPGMEKFLIS